MSMFSPLPVCRFDGECCLIARCVIDVTGTSLRLLIRLMECKAIICLTGMSSQIWFNDGHLRYSPMRPNVPAKRRVPRCNNEELPLIARSLARSVGQLSF